MPTIDTSAPCMQSAETMLLASAAGAWPTTRATAGSVWQKVMYFSSAFSASGRRKRRAFWVLVLVYRHGLCPHLWNMQF